MSPEQLRQYKNTESSGDKYCLDESEPCRLTKKQMCEKIVYHAIVAKNLIATIMSVVPLQNETGDVAGGFMFNRLTSLKNGVFCVPPHYSEIQSLDDNDRIQKIFKHLNHMTEKECKSNGGFVLKMTKEKMDELAQDEKFGRKYFDFSKKINIFYQEALINLYNILENLQNNTSLSTQRLNELSSQTKNIIDELYLKTQFNYLLAILVVLDFDFSKNTTAILAKRKRKEFLEKQ